MLLNYHTNQRSGHGEGPFLIRMASKDGTRKILFIHGNYPGQFRHICGMCGRDLTWEVVFLTEEGFPNQWAIPGVRIQTYRKHREARPETHHYLQPIEGCLLRGQAVLRGIHELLLAGFQPELVVFHGGMGLGLFLREILPEAKLVGYFEWYFHSELSRWLYADYPFDRRLQMGMRNLTIEHELLFCDVAIVPSAWQKSVFPASLQEQLTVLFDGIDANYFKPAPATLDRSLRLPLAEGEGTLALEPHHLVLTYATRGMEPLRGFPEFMRMLPPLLAEVPQLQVVIAGSDRQAYSYPAPSHGGSWKQTMLAELGGVEGAERIHFTGSLVYEDYRSLLWRSDLHCYFTRPFVTSWSLLEAVACGTPLCLTANGATAMVADQARVLVDLDTPKDTMAMAVAAYLREPHEPREPPAGGWLQEEYRLERCLLGWHSLLQLMA